MPTSQPPARRLEDSPLAAATPRRSLLRDLPRRRATATANGADESDPIEPVCARRVSTAQPAWEGTSGTVPEPRLRVRPSRPRRPLLVAGIGPAKASPARPSRVRDGKRASRYALATATLRSHPDDEPAASLLALRGRSVSARPVPTESPSMKQRAGRRWRRSAQRWRLLAAGRPGRGTQQRAQPLVRFRLVSSGTYIE